MKTIARFLCLVTAMFALTVSFCACSSNDDDEKVSLNEYGFEGNSVIPYDYFPFAGDVTVALVHRSDMPSWLATKITSDEDVRLWAVWEGTCDGETIYLVHNHLMSVLYEGYQKDGNKFVFASEEEKTQYLSTEANHWKRIY